MKFNRDQNLLWDTSLDYEDYPSFIKKIFLKFYLSEEKKFHHWLENITVKYKDDIDWWVTNSMSRNPYSSDLYKSLCIILTIRVLAKNKKFPKIIYVDSLFLKKTLELNLNIKKINCKIISKKNNFYYSLFFCRNINSIILFLKSYFLTIYFSGKKKIFNNNSISLIDTFIIDESKQEENYYGDLYKKYIKKEKNFFFVPTSIYKNLFSFIKIIKSLDKRKFIFKEHYLGIKDILFCINHLNRKKKFYKKYKKYSNIDLSLILLKEIKYNLDYNSIFISLSNYLFSKKLKQNSVKIKKIINWFENQCVDKGWNFGFRINFKNSEQIGYQAMTNAPMYHSLSPSQYEYSFKVIPKKIAVINRSLIKERSRFLKNKNNFILSPALRSQDVFNIKYKKKKTYKIVVFLEGNKISSDLNIVKKFIYVAQRLPELIIYIKKHPRLNFDESTLLVPRNIKFSSKSFPNLASKSKISSCGGATTTVLQSLAYGCQLIIPTNNGYDRKTFKNSI